MTPSVRWRGTVSNCSISLWNCGVETKLEFFVWFHRKGHRRRIVWKLLVQSLLCISRAEHQVADGAQQAQTLTSSELFSFLQAWTCPIASLLVTRTNGPSQMVYASCFPFFDTVWNEGHRPHARPNTGPSQQSSKCLIHVEAPLSQFLKIYSTDVVAGEKKKQNTTDGVSLRSSSEGVQI